MEAHCAAAASPGRVVVASVLLAVEPSGTVVLQPNKADMPAVDGVLYETRGGDDAVVVTMHAAGQTLSSVDRAYNALIEAGVEYEAGGMRFGRMSGHARFAWQGRQLQLVREAMLAAQPQTPAAPAELETCCICMENKVDALILPCQHQVCVECMNVMLGGHTQHSWKCALCRRNMDEVLTQYGSVRVNRRAEVYDSDESDDDEDSDDE